MRHTLFVRCSAGSASSNLEADGGLCAELERVFPELKPPMPILVWIACF